MKKILFLFSIAGFLNSHGQQYDTYGRSQSVREWQQTVQHYESMKPSSSYKQQGTVQQVTSQDLTNTFNTIENLFGLKKRKKTPQEIQQEALAQKKAEEQRIAERRIAWNNNEKYLSQLIVERKIRKHWSYYNQIMKAAKDAGLPEIWNGRVFGYNSKEFDNLCNFSSSTLHKYFPDKDHPISFTFNDLTAQQKSSGQYRSYRSLKDLIKAFIDDGKNNFSTVTDKADKPVDLVSNSDENYRIKYYWLDFNAFQYGKFSFGKYPYIAFSSWGLTEEEYQQIITYQVNDFLATGLYNFEKTKESYGTNFVLKLKKEHTPEVGVAYEFDMYIDTRAGVVKFGMGLYKSEDLIKATDKKTDVLQSLQLMPDNPNPGSNSILESLKIKDDNKVNAGASGFTSYTSFLELATNIIADGKNNYANITHPTYSVVNIDGACNVNKALKFKFKDYYPIEYCGVASWEFPVIRGYFKTAGEDETNTVFETFIKEFKKSKNFIQFRNEFTDDKTGVYFNYVDKTDGYVYQVWLEKKEASATGKYNLRFGIDKKRQ